MSGSGQDNSSGAGSRNPVVRLRGFPKKDADPPPSTPVIPPKAPNAPAEVRFKRRASSQPPVEDVSPPPGDLPPVEEPVPPADEVSPAPVSPAEYPGETVEPFEEYPVEPAEQTFEQPFEEAPVEPPEQIFEQPFEEAPVEPAEQTFEQPFEEIPVEQYAADAAPVEPPESETTDAPAGASSQEAIPKSPTPSVAGNPSVAGVRLRFPAKAAPAPIQAPAASDPAGQAGTRPAGPSAAPASLAYTPDTHIERIHRRQWWKYDLRVKSGRQPAEEAQQQA